MWAKSTGIVFVGTYLSVQISSKVGQRGQGLIVVECCGGSESSRYDRKADKSVLDIFN